MTQKSQRGGGLGVLNPFSQADGMNQVFFYFLRFWLTKMGPNELLPKIWGTIHFRLIQGVFVNL